MLCKVVCKAERVLRFLEVGAFKIVIVDFCSLGHKGSELPDEIRIERKSREVVNTQPEIVREPACLRIVVAGLPVNGIPESEWSKRVEYLVVVFLVGVAIVYPADHMLDALIPLRFRDEGIAEHEHDDAKGTTNWLKPRLSGPKWKEIVP